VYLSFFRRVFKFALKPLRGAGLQNRKQVFKTGLKTRF